MKQGVMFEFITAFEDNDDVIWSKVFKNTKM